MFFFFHVSVVANTPLSEASVCAVGQKRSRISISVSDPRAQVVQQIFVVLIELE